MSDKSAQVAVPSSPRGAVALLEAMRPAHWVKNAFVIVPLLFAGRYFDWQSWWRALAAAGAFCLLSSAAYLLNDVLDRSADRAHPAKRARPVASGRLSAGGAIAAAWILLLGGLGLAMWPCVSAAPAGLPLGGKGLVVWAGAYMVLNLLYSLWLKHRVVIDVIVVALGFVLRAMAGAAAIAVPISPWLVVCTFTLCLFIALSKRRTELIDLPADVARATRKTHRTYTVGELERMGSISAAVAIMTYCLYCLAPRTIQHIGSGHMVWTIPLVIYGIFRYDRISRRVHKGDVVGVLLSDRIIWVVLVLYVVLSLCVMRFGASGAFQQILDVGFPAK